MHITLITVGRIKESYLAAGIAEYAKRLTRYCKLDQVEVPDEKAPETLSDKEMEQIKEREGERILSKVRDAAYVIALAIEGRQQSSEELAATLSGLSLSGKSEVVFIIGGSLGLSPAVLKRADMKLSFSKMTFPHQLMKLILVEQIYRAYRIQKNEPYHK